MQTNVNTRLCGILGKPVNHSISPAIHNAAFEALALNYVYLAFHVDDLEGAMRGMRALNVRGFSVTMPHKVEVIRYLDDIDPIAQKIGAVNTVVNTDGLLQGYNTDWLGFTRSLEAVTPIRNKKVVIAGTGGAARALGFGITEKGGTLTILNRSERSSAAAALAAELGCDWGPLSRKSTITEADIVVNATLLGMPPYEKMTIADAAYLRAGQVVYDVVYNPLETRLLREAAAKGCRVVPGSEMLLLQALAQFELWTGQTPPVDLMRTILQERLRG
ncbi:shikimate dehydrogenase [candidate division KSB3 bacterium]|uniref:Shikimate dehydrogenase (NADP(+)) n=1 Tax=candidate division KSB3 bacterium TaxID=2044937 RepID=A0A2G6E997_9BACT|nr:MAG: shikimate dehydrogenase [candidate division KSB3 bacterium]PIE30645.1 MAG: shikimate dehydrogenase [candidate division KSB3 bacterium]